jgi:hypothetical protein
VLSPLNVTRTTIEPPANAHPAWKVIHSCVVNVLNVIQTTNVPAIEPANTTVVSIRAKRIHLVGNTQIALCAIMSQAAHVPKIDHWVIRNRTANEDLLLKMNRNVFTMWIVPAN